MSQLVYHPLNDERLVNIRLTLTGRDLGGLAGAAPPKATKPQQEWVQRQQRIVNLINSMKQIQYASPTEEATVAAKCQVTVIW